MDAELLKSACSGERRRDVEFALLMLFEAEWPEMLVCVLGAVIGMALDRAERRDKTRSFKKAAKKIESVVASAAEACAEAGAHRWMELGGGGIVLLIGGDEGEPAAYVEPRGDAWAFCVRSPTEAFGEFIEAPSRLAAKQLAEEAGVAGAETIDALVRGVDAEQPRTAFVIVPAFGDDDCAILPFTRDVRNA